MGSMQGLKVRGVRGAWVPDEHSTLKSSEIKYKYLKHLLIIDSRRTWVDAENACHFLYPSNFPHLASIHSYQEMYLVSSMLERNTDFTWFGLQRHSMYITDSTVHL